MRKRAGKQTKAARRRGKIEVGNSVEAVADFTHKLRDAAIKQFGSDAAPEVSEFFGVEGLPLSDNFALQYVLGIDIIPLGRLVSIMGPPGGGKTSFGIWLGKIFMNFPGLFVYKDGERKVSPPQFTSILQKSWEDMEAQLFPTPVESVADLVKKLEFYGKFYVKEFPDKVMPVYFLVDSISALTGGKALEKYKRGADEENNMQAAHNAKTLTDSIRKFTAVYLAKQPFFIAMITHQKEKIQTGFGASYGKQMDTGTGGVHKDFQATWRLIIETTKRHKESIAEETGGRKVEHTLYADKCGMGEDHRKIKYVTHTYMDDNGNRRMDFDFDSSLIWLLLDDLKTSKKWLKDKIGLVKKDAKTYNVNVLKLKDLSMREAGRAINESPELVKAMQKYYRVEHLTPFGGERDPEVAKVEEEEEDAFE